MNPSIQALRTRVLGAIATLTSSARPELHARAYLGALGIADQLGIREQLSIAAINDDTADPDGLSHLSVDALEQLVELLEERVAVRGDAEPSAANEPAGLLLLVDAHNLLWRAFYAVGVTRAVRAFVGQVQAVIRALGATHALAVFDSGGDGGRRQLFPGYKAHRKPDPPEAAPLFPLARKAIDLAAIVRVEDPGFEADDLIASYARQRPRSLSVVIVSSDKDLEQLCDDPQVQIYDTAKRRYVGAAEVEQRWGVPPALLGDLLALWGDDSDNVPGVPGIGPKTGAALLGEHGSLEAVLAAAPTMRQPKRAEALTRHAESARLARRLVALRDDLPLPIPVEALRVGGHHCHARGCTQPCPPRHLMCARHWAMVPKHLQRAVWNAYRPGQEIDKRPSEAWTRAADHAIAAVLQAEVIAKSRTLGAPPSGYGCPRGGSRPCPR